MMEFSPDEDYAWLGVMIFAEKEHYFDWLHGHGENDGRQRLGTKNAMAPRGY
jgi:hypothetical protein